MINYTIDPIPTIIQEFSYNCYNMLSIDKYLVDKILRAPTQVNLNGICDYCTTCVNFINCSLQEAKKNIEQYLVVGLTEQLEVFFQILETFMPGLFYNSTAIYRERSMCTRHTYYYLNDI